MLEIKNLKAVINNKEIIKGLNLKINPGEDHAIMGPNGSGKSTLANILSRHLNVGFSGGEKKKNEILQLKILEPKLAILDETDSGLDIDALKIVADGVNSYKNKKNSFLIITHYQRLLNFIKPDFIHVLSAGKIIKTGSKELGEELEKTGYTNLI